MQKLIIEKKSSDYWTKNLNIYLTLLHLFFFFQEKKEREYVNMRERKREDLVDIVRVNHARETKLSCSSCAQVHV